MIIMTNASITGNFLSAFGVSSMRIGGNYLRRNNLTKENIARIAKAARNRVVELGSLSSGAKMAMKIFVKRVFTIANLQN